MAVNTGRTELHIAFTRNVYTDQSLRMVTVPLGSDGVPGAVPTSSVGVDNAGRASSTAVALLPGDAGPIVACVILYS
jgi:hypothetical protein